MYFFTLKKQDIRYPLSLYGKSNYLIQLMESNYRTLLNRSLTGNWVVENQNVFVQFIVNMGIDITWDNDYIYNYIKGKHKRVASQLGITSLFNQGKTHHGQLFPSKLHKELIIIPFGDSEFSSDYYFNESRLNDLVPFKTIYTTDNKQRWNIHDITKNMGEDVSELNTTIIQLDPYALLIGYVRYCRSRIKENMIVGITPHSYFMKFPIINFYRQHNYFVAMNYCLYGPDRYHFEAGKWTVIDYGRFMKDYAAYIHNTMTKSNPKTFNQYVEQCSTLGTPIVNKSLYPYQGLSKNFTKLEIFYTFNTFKLACCYAEYLLYSGRRDNSFKNEIRKVHQTNILSNIKDPIWRDHLQMLSDTLKSYIT